MLQLSVGKDASEGKGSVRAPSPGANTSISTCRKLLSRLRDAVGSRGDGWCQDLLSGSQLPVNVS